MKASREEALRALNEPVNNWIDQAEVEYEPRPSRMVLSVQLSPAHLTWVFEEADRRGVKPSVVIEALVNQAQPARRQSE
ncbi:hypothetical protein [Micromonospora noduli]|uniref:hypothetical protein n=1 Tax=Micromonospora noduli TaxID=709876 RepID=UPI000DC3E6E9|nr:hypothetical protein [Micromonospora noduli]RAO22964.1 hypothetical protein LUPAC07_00563 [Micromonospora noduli]